MTPRELRRAAERQTRKSGTATAPSKPAPISAAQLAANQANARHSTGPRTETGRQTASLNALKTGLTGRTVLLPTDDLAAYETLLANFENQYHPASPEERALVQSIVDTTWRVQRIANLEFALYAKGALDFADQFQELDSASRSLMIQAETYLKYEKSIRNLNTQEARLVRRLGQDTKELRRMQQERLEQEAAIQEFLQRRAANTAATQTEPSENGFEYSNSETPAHAPDLAPFGREEEEELAA